ncbi:GNAT family N-acetyltransferase [Cellulophaga lytica]|uniref:GNAT family N-acetyltransferase n=1 Tax=Cellulophaga lytica TaxID=979 RepID=UPI0032E4B4CE
MIHNVNNLKDNVVQLIPLKEKHIDLLWPIAQQIDVHKYGSNDISTLKKLTNYIHTAIEDKNSIPFAVFNMRTSAYVGSTRFGNIDDKNKVLHIGWTWISPNTQGTGLNHKMKYLMLTYAFEDLNFNKVEFRIDERNIKSRKAVEKLGASLEGILRQNVITKNNIKRNSCCYGILKEEWAIIKQQFFNT